MRKHIKTTGATLLTAAVAAGCLLTGAGPASALTLDGPYAASAQSPAPTVKDLVAVRDASTGDTTVTGIGRADSAVLIRWASGANFIAMTGSDGSFSDTRKAGLPIDATVSVRSTVSEAWQPVAIVEGEPTSPVVASRTPARPIPVSPHPWSRSRVRARWTRASPHRAHRRLRPCATLERSTTPGPTPPP